MNGDRLDVLVRGLPPDRASVVREFARHPQDEQLVFLYVELVELQQGLKQQKPLRERLYDFGMVGAFLAYVLLDRGRAGDLPWPK